MTTTDVRPGHAPPDAQTGVAGADPNLLDGHTSRDAQPATAVEDSTSGDQTTCDTHTTPVAGTPVRPGQHPSDAQDVGAGTDLSYVYLSLAAETLDDLERSRIAAENRLRSLRDVYGLTDVVPEVKVAAAMVKALEDVEHQATLNLGRIMRRHPLGPWVARTVGVGAKQGARLLAAIGDPYFNSLHNRPRTVSELWAYCGYHTLPASRTTRDTHPTAAGGDHLGGTDHLDVDTRKDYVGVAAKRAKGRKSNWSTDAKMRAWLIATSCIKQAASPYRAVYDARRAHTAVTHPVVAKDPVYPEWTPGHSHNDALRIVSKALLRDLWREARALAEPNLLDGQPASDTQDPPAVEDPTSGDHEGTDTQNPDVAGTLVRPGHSGCDTQSGRAGTDPNSLDGQRGHDAQRRVAAEGSNPEVTR